MALRPARLALLLIPVGAVAVLAAGRDQPPGPTYVLTATIPIGLQPYTDVDVDPATGRAYLAVRDGLRVVDTTTGTMGPTQHQLELSGTIELAPDIDRIFAEIDDDYVGFIDLRSYHLDRAVPVESPGRLVYEPATGELYVFSTRVPRVLVLDGRTGDAKSAVALPGWSGDGILKTPGRIYVTVPPRRELYVIETDDRHLAEVPLFRNFRNTPARFELVADTAGRTLFATDHREVLAIDVGTGDLLARIPKGAATLMYDDAAGMLVAHARESDWAGMKLVAYRLEERELVRVSEQRLPLEGGLYPFATAFGFVSGFFTGSVGLPERGAGQFRRSYFTVWQRDEAVR